MKEEIQLIIDKLVRLCESPQEIDPYFGDNLEFFYRDNINCVIMDLEELQEGYQLKNK